MNWHILIFLLFILIMHEMGHLLSAKILDLRVEEVGFDWKPFPRFYVSIIDNGIPFIKRVWFLLSGNLMTISLFIIFLTAFGDVEAAYYAFAYQLIVETNPFYSDYVMIIFSYIYKDEFRQQLAYSGKASSGGPRIDYKEKFKQEYMFSTRWYLHFLLWGGCIVLLLSPILDIAS